MFRMWDVLNVGCLECGMFVMCESSGMCDVGFLEV